MPTRGYLLSEEFKPRVEQTVQTVERELKGGVGPRAPGPQRTSTNVQRLRITSADPLDTFAGVDYFPARTLQFDPELGLWDSLFDYDDAVVFDTSGSLLGGSGDGSGGGTEVTAGTDVWGRQCATVLLGDGEPFVAFAVITGVAAGSGGSFSSDGGFWAKLTEAPTLGSGASNCEGYGWQKVNPLEDCGEFGDGDLIGSHDALPAFEVNGNTVPIETNGKPTKVWMRPALDSLGLFLGYYLFEWQLGLESIDCDAGSGIPGEVVDPHPALTGATFSQCLFRCSAILGGYWAVKIGGHWFPIDVLDSEGTSIIGGE